MMLEIKLEEKTDMLLKEIAYEINISAEDLAYMSIEKLINEYRMRKAIREYVEEKVSLGMAAEIAGMSKRKFMAVIEDMGVPLNVNAHDFMKGLGFLYGLRGYRR
jgi:predicted HTH domain antitoxin